MYRIFIIIGILMIVFAFSGKAQSADEATYTKILRQAEKKLDSIKCSKLVDICTFETFKKDISNKIERSQSYFVDIMELQKQMKLTTESMCLNYHSYKKYRKCMLIFNK